MKYMKDKKGLYFIDRVGNIDIKIYKDFAGNFWKETGVLLIILSVIGSFVVGTLVSGVLGLLIGLPAMIFVLGKLTEISDF